jgi:predicted nucleic acid-binding protein
MMRYADEVRPRVYLETTIVSYLVGWLSRHDLYVAANQEYTRQWWAERRQDFELYASAVVVQEVRRGTPDLAASRLAYRTDVGILGVSDAAETLKEHLLTAAALPRNAELDALHIAVAAVNGMDYLLTWNCRHIANAVTLPRSTMTGRIRAAVRLHTARADEGRE